jgi:hypothetical protein
VLTARLVAGEAAVRRQLRGPSPAEALKTLSAFAAMITETPSLHG